MHQFCTSNLVAQALVINFEKNYEETNVLLAGYFFKNCGRRAIYLNGSYAKKAGQDIRK